MVCGAPKSTTLHISGVWPKRCKCLICFKQGRTQPNYETPLPSVSLRKYGCGVSRFEPRDAASHCVFGHVLEVATAAKANLEGQCHSIHRPQKRCLPWSQLRTHIRIGAAVKKRICRLKTGPGGLCTGARRGVCCARHHWGSARALEGEDRGEGSTGMCVVVGRAVCCSAGRRCRSCSAGKRRGVGPAAVRHLLAGTCPLLHPCRSENSEK